MRNNFEKFVISQKAMLVRDEKCLIVETVSHLGVWDLPGGRIDKNETGEESFAREIKEELGISKFKNIGVADCDTWNNYKNEPMCGIVNLIKNDTDKITLSPEHSQMKWISKKEVDNYKYCWPVMGYMIKKGFEKL